MKHAYINGVILDGSKDMEPVEGKMILTDGEKIIAMEAQKDVPAGYETVDLKGRYIMPGLVNMHVHLPGNGKPTDKQEDNSAKVKKLTSNALFRYLVRVMCQNYAKTQLMSGVTTLRTMGGVMAVDSAVRDRINTGKAVGPRILAANMAVSVEGGHMAGSLACIAHSADEAAQLVENIAKDNPDLIKLMITGGVLDAKVKGEPGELKMPPEYVKAACDKAHDLGMKVAAHVESPEGVRVALENGVDTIEHGAKPDDEIMRLFKERGACHIATFSPALPFAKFDREVTHMSEMEQYNGQVVFEGIIECAKRCLEEGVPVGLGTDTGCPYITQYDMWRELNYFHKFCGVSNAFALYTATKLNAQLAGVGDITGSIEEGKCADFIVTTKNPLEDLTVLRNVDMVVARGKIINNPKVKRMAEVDKELDKFI